MDISNIEALRRKEFMLLPAHTFICAGEELSVPIVFLPMLPSTIDPYVIEHNEAHSRLISSLQKIQIYKTEEDGLCVLAVLFGNAEVFKVPLLATALKILWNRCKSAGKVVVYPYDPERSIQVTDSPTALLSVDWVNIDEKDF